MQQVRLLLCAALWLTSLTANAQKLPDRTVTPGAINLSLTADKICAHGFSTKKYRHTTAAMKAQVCASYHVSPCPKRNLMELDHLVPLELGGSDEVNNLWVQMAPEYHQKDKLENYLRREVCDALPEERQEKLRQRQRCLVADWYACGHISGLW